MQCITDRHNGARKFWTYVSSLSGKVKVLQIRHQNMGLPVSNLDRHLADHMRKLYDFSNGDPEIKITDEYPINEYRLSNKLKCKVTRPTLDRAIKHIGAHTA
ncbi:hypothetical protein MRX96_023227 [Rhipicephalus microplus]